MTLTPPRPLNPAVAATFRPPVMEARRWIDAIENDTDPVVLPEQACVVSEILEAIYTSAKTGEPVYFNKK